MSFITERKSGDTVYLYEVTSYWDSEKKQPRQHRKYLGRKDPRTGQPIKPRHQVRTPRLARDYGQIYLLRQVALRIGLTQILQEVFPDHCQSLLALAYFEICEAAPLYLFPYWVESAYLSDVEALSSKTLSILTQRIGQMERERRQFTQKWVARYGHSSQAVVFDITSLSSYSELLDFVEWGYNRDGENLPQINLGMIYAEDHRLPLHYQIYPGSIRDVSTLKNMVQHLKLFDLKQMILVLDRGFYSGQNVSDMKEAELVFVIPMPRTLKRYGELHSRNKRKLSSPLNAFAFKDEVYFHTRESIEIKTVPLQAHLYFNEQSRSGQTTRFLKRMLDIETAANNKAFQDKEELQTFIAKQIKGVDKLFTIRRSELQFKLKRKSRSLSQAMALMGTTIMLTNQTQLKRDVLLSWYRQKDYLEKIFDTLKNEFDGKRLRARSMDAVEGRMFVKFLSLILHSSLCNTMRENGLFKKYTIREVIYELKKLKVVEMDDGKLFLTEISKKQRHLFKQFEVKIPINVKT